MEKKNIKNKLKSKLLGYQKPVNDEYAQELQTVLAHPPNNMRDMIPAAQQWMGQNGVVSDWHKNNLIMDALASIPYSTDVEIELDPEKKYLKYVIYINPFYFIRHPLMFIGYKKDMIVRVKEIINMYVPLFNCDLEIHYGHPRSTDSSKG